jgi:hypothetical protein
MEKKEQAKFKKQKKNEFYALNPDKINVTPVKGLSVSYI